MKTVVLCGSRRFKDEVKNFGEELEKLGVVVFYPHMHVGEEVEEWEKLSDYRKELVLLGLAHDHFHKIKMADVVFVYNKGGYSGVSVTLEMGCAVALGKPIYALEPDKKETSRHALLNDFVKTPKELVKKL